MGNFHCLKFDQTCQPAGPRNNISDNALRRGESRKARMKQGEEDMAGWPRTIWSCSCLNAGARCGTLCFISSNAVLHKWKSPKFNPKFVQLRENRGSRSILGLMRLVECNNLETAEGKSLPKV